MTGEILYEKMLFEQRLEGGEGVAHVVFWMQGCLGRRESTCEGPEMEEHPEISENKGIEAESNGRCRKAICIANVIRKGKSGLDQSRSHRDAKLSV